MATITPCMLPLNSMWRLTTDVQLRGGMVGSYYNDELRNNLDVRCEVAHWDEYIVADDNNDGPRYRHGWWDEAGRRERYAEWQAERTKGIVFPKGTIIRIDRYHVSRSGEDQITIMLITSPEPRLCPKKMGGRMRGKGRVYLWLDDFNNLGPVEEVNDII